MKFGIMTFHRAVNYGAVLQTYALQTTLAELGMDSEVIDYRSDKIEGLYKIFSPLLSNIKNLSIYTKAKKKIVFNRFLKNHIVLSKEYKSKEELKKIEKEYAAVITGSDQVWCEKCAREDSVFFLDFIKNSKKKYSYAASIGKSSVNEEMEKKYAALLEAYSCVSIREGSSKDLMHRCNKEDVFVHIDPTLLLNEQKWNEIASKRNKSGEYILLYTVLGQYKLYEFANHLSEETGLPIIYLNEEMLHRVKDYHYKVGVSPEEFVGYFANAKYVVTNSFHGTAFSIIYHKKFFVEIEAVGRKNIRAEELMEKLGLEKRNINRMSFEQYDEEICWNSVDNILEKERNKSKNYLKNISKLCL